MNNSLVDPEKNSKNQMQRKKKKKRKMQNSTKKSGFYTNQFEMYRFLKTRNQECPFQKNCT